MSDSTPENDPVHDSLVGKPKRSNQALIAIFSTMLLLALSAFALMSMTETAGAAFGSIWFLGIFPAFLCAIIGYVGDPQNDRSDGFYWGVPTALVVIVTVASVFVLREGVICILMLAPVWLGAGWAGIFIMRASRKTPRNGHKLHASLLMLPLLAGMVESQITFAHENVTISRSIEVAATPMQVWRYCVANPSIAPSEGRWNVSQNVIGIPRPRATTLAGTGVGAVRTAYWGGDINFDEVITAWEPGKRVGWAFSFTNSSIEAYIDQHISPDGQFLKIESGDYLITPLANGKTRLTLRTNYIAKTHVNPYAKLWGELVLGDVHNNILTIIKDRAEVRSE
jgi:hypothetical protein